MTDEEKVKRHIIRAADKGIIELQLLADLLQDASFDITNPKLFKDQISNFQSMFVQFVMTDLMNQLIKDQPEDLVDELRKEFKL